MILNISNVNVILKVNAELATWPPVPLLHPDVTVVLSYACLRVQEGHAYAALSTQAGIVAATLLNGLPVELVPEPEEDTFGEETWF